VIHPKIAKIQPLPAPIAAFFPPLMEFQLSSQSAGRDHAPGMQEAFSSVEFEVFGRVSEHHTPGGKPNQQLHTVHFCFESHNETILANP
jgi:hypothetical protein